MLTKSALVSWIARLGLGVCPSMARESPPGPLASFGWIGKIKYFEIELCKTSVYQAIDR